MPKDSMKARMARLRSMKKSGKRTSKKTKKMNTRGEAGKAIARRQLKKGSVLTVGNKKVTVISQRKVSQVKVRDSRGAIDTIII